MGSSRRMIAPYRVGGESLCHLASGNGGMQLVRVVTTTALKKLRRSPRPKVANHVETRGAGHSMVEDHEVDRT